MKQRNLLKYFIVFLGFATVFAVVFLSKKASLEKEFLAAAQKVPSIRDFGSSSIETALKIAHSYGPYAGIGLGLVAFLVTGVLLLLLKIVRLAKFSLANVFLLLVVYGALLALAIELIYYEARYTVLALAVIFFVGKPLYYASIGALILAVLLYALCFLKNRLKKTPLSETIPVKEAVEPEVKDKSVTGKLVVILAALVVLPFISGCSLLGWLEGNVCDVTPDSEHCFQGAAVDEGSADACAKVKQPAKFKDMGSNPPKDKCYLMVAENTGDLEACNKIAGGLMSYTREECILGAAVANENPSGCQMLSGGDRAQCVSKLGPLITPEKVLDVDSQIEILNNELAKGSDPNMEKQLKGLQDKKNDMLAVMTDANKKEYGRQSDPLNKEIIGDWAVGTIDNVTKNKLVDMNEKLKAAGAGLTKEQYVTFRDYYTFVNDPANNIEKMDDAALAKDKFGDKVKNVVDKLKFWKTNDTSEEKALDEQIRFYERMSERQAGIDKGLSVREQGVEKVLEKVKDAAVDKAGDMVKDKAVEEIFGEVAGNTVGATTKVLGEAIDEVKEAAKSAEFRGLVNAYDKGMEDELGKAGGNVELAHQRVVKSLMADPYSYAQGDSFAKYGNLIENKDCDGSNPHCVNKTVFWKAMKKSYTYQHPS